MSSVRDRIAALNRSNSTSNSSTVSSLNNNNSNSNSNGKANPNPAINPKSDQEKLPAEQHQPASTAADSLNENNVNKLPLNSIEIKKQSTAPAAMQNSSIKEADDSVNSSPASPGPGVTNSTGSSVAERIAQLKRKESERRTSLSQQDTPATSSLKNPAAEEKNSADMKTTPSPHEESNKNSSTNEITKSLVSEERHSETNSPNTPPTVDTNEEVAPKLTIAQRMARLSNAGKNTENTSTKTSSAPSSTSGDTSKLSIAERMALLNKASGGDKSPVVTPPLKVERGYSDPLAAITSDSQGYGEERQPVLKSTASESSAFASSTPSSSTKGKRFSNIDPAMLSGIKFGPPPTTAMPRRNTVASTTEASISGFTRSNDVAGELIHTTMTRAKRTSVRRSTVKKDDLSVDSLVEAIDAGQPSRIQSMTLDKISLNMESIDDIRTKLGLSSSKDEHPETIQAKDASSHPPKATAAENPKDDDPGDRVVDEKTHKEDQQMESKAGNPKETDSAADQQKESNDDNPTATAVSEPI